MMALTDDKTGKKYFIYTYGCQMNANDTERLAGQLRALGYGEAGRPDDAGVILLNTCCVRESAEKKIHGKIGELKRLKAADPNLIIGVAGCMAQKDRDKLFKRAPHIDLVLGTHNIHQLGESIAAIGSSRGRVLAVWDQAERLAPGVPTVRKNGVAAWLPIMYGCNNFCTYCIVPYVRGRERSRPLDEVVGEATELAAQGFREITLLGQNVNSYGKDIPGHADFADLLAAVDKMDGIARIRYMTSHPRDMNDRVIAAVKTSRHVCEHFHLPIQAGSDAVLTAMNRGYATADYRRLVAAIRAAIPGCSLTTDIIVGFPGETEAMFADTLALVAEVRFDAAYTFLYSQRSGTPAAAMADQVPPAVKKERLKRLMDLQNEVSLALNRELVGADVEVLVEGESKNDANKMMGRTRTNKIVIWDRTGREAPGDLATVAVTAAQTWVLKGRLTAVK
jgi:tRNA-2-methylthio-N6-dimethylallyladenosine synthase